MSTPGQPATALGLERYLLQDDTTTLIAGWLAQLTSGQDVPRYGSTEWLLAPRDLQIAGCVVAAEAYRRDGRYAAQADADVRAAQAHLERLQDAAEFAVIAKRVQALGSGSNADHAELVRRRAVVTRTVALQQASAA